MTRVRISISHFTGCAFLAFVLCLPASLRAQTSVVAPDAASVSKCSLLQKQLRWHEPFFGLSTWQQTAAESLAHAPTACREAIAAGQAPEVAIELADLFHHEDKGGVELRRYVYRLACQLRMPEARRQILDGVHEPAVYADCADALFAMNWQDREALQLRRQYLVGLRAEPLKTHVPAALLQPPWVETLAPVLRAYDQAKWPGRDALYRAMCVQRMPVNEESRTVCAGLHEREPEWIKKQILDGQIDAGINKMAKLAPNDLPQFVGLLRQFDTEHRAGRDRLYGMLCSRHAPWEPTLIATCKELRPSAEGFWVASSKREKVDAQIGMYMFGGRIFAGVLLALAVLLLGHRVIYGRRRAS